MKKIAFLSFLFIHVLFSVFSQRVENVKTDIQGDRVFITYDITETLPGDTVFISVYANDENFNELPSFNFTGALGKIYQGGRGQQIECYAKRLLTNYTGQLAFDVKIELVYRFVLETEAKDLRRGKDLHLRWLVSPHQNVGIHLMKGGKEESVIATVVGNVFTWKVPARQALGKDYQLRLVVSDRTLATKKFSIKRRVATWIKVLPLPLAALTLMITKGAKEDKLPEPPGLGLN